MTLDEVKRQLFVDSDDVIGNDMVDLYEAQNCCDTSFSIGYNKAIDDFKKEIKDAIDIGLEKVSPLSDVGSNLCTFYAIVDEIAEQLKGGDGE